MPDSIFTQEQLTQLVEALKPIIVETASKSAADHVTKRNKSFEEKFDTFTQQFTPPKTEKEPEEEKITATQRSINAEEQIKKLRQELKAKDDKSNLKEMRSKAESFLLKKGIPTEQVKAVLAQLQHEDKLISVDSTGRAIFKVNDETFDLEEGLEGWVKAEGKAFVQDHTAKSQGLRDMKRPGQKQVNTQFRDAAERDEALDQVIRSMR
jgi:hypothetical protein